jgi:tetraprenyl-beta-curcumene synthase
MPRGAIDTTYVGFGQAWALGAAVVRELAWGLRAVSREVERWRRYAAKIPDATIREDALAALEHKRSNTDGAALFWTIPMQRCPRLLRLLVAYEIMADYLDSAVERGAGAGMANGRQLHLALVDAVDVQRPVSDYYRHHPWRDDGGYLSGLVEACRHGCARLPSYSSVRPLLMRAATLAQVQGLSHEPNVSLREAVLQAWAEREGEGEGGNELGWYETAGAASAWLTVLALLAAAAEPTPMMPHLAGIYAAYLPWISLTATLLDSYGDLVEDQRNNENSYIARYGSLELAVNRINEVVRRATREAGTLHNGERHSVILAAMIAMYLSKDSARTPDMLSTSRQLLRSGGPLAMLLGPVLRAWRVLSSMRDT